jgi:Asp-tRNA(Asn)/Glu-tRNA(Gln) amidotransferase A subunit family amidase
MIAQDSRPTWRKGDSLKPFVYTQGRANLIKDMMQERGITQQQMTERFPNRPSTREEFQAVLEWLKEQGKKAEASAPPSSAQVNDGYYAIPVGELGFSKPHFFRVKHGAKSGKWANTQFLTEQASDENYPVRGARKVQVMAWLAANEQAARELYGTLISRCSRCNRTLTDHDNPYFPAYGPECGGK